MEKSDIPVSSRHVLYLTLTLIVPLAIVTALIFTAPLKPQQTDASRLLAAGIIGAVLLLCLGILVAVVRRHAVELRPDALVVRHSMYTFTLRRDEMAAAEARVVTAADELRLTSRSNGIALFGFLSGWFWRGRGDPVFCAVSAFPVQLIRFEGGARCRLLALSASPELAARIVVWANRG